MERSCPVCIVRREYGRDDAACPLCGAPDAPRFVRPGDGWRLASVMPAVFTCALEPDREVVFVRPSGELDCATSGRVELELGELRRTGWDQIVLSLRDVTFADSTAIKLIVKWSRLAREDAFIFAVEHGPRQVQRAFELAGLADHPVFRPLRLASA